MSNNSQLDDAKEIIDAPKVEIIYKQTKTPTVSKIKRVDLVLRSSYIDDILSNKYPTIIAGSNLAEIVNQQYAKNFLSDWFSNKNLPNIIRNLNKLTKKKIDDYLIDTTNKPELNSEFEDILEGRTAIRNSLITSCIRQVALDLEGELNLPFNHLHRICFILVLVPAQTRIHLSSIPLHHNQATHSMLIDLVRERLVTGLLNDYQF